MEMRGNSYLAAGTGVRNNGWRHQKNVINIYLLRGPMMGRKLTLPHCIYPVFGGALSLCVWQRGKCIILVLQGRRTPQNHDVLSLYKLIHYWGMRSLKYPSGSRPGFCLFVPKLLQSGTCFSFLPFALFPEEIIIYDTCFLIFVTSLEKCARGKENLLGLILFLWTVLSQIWRYEHNDIPKTPMHII